MTAAHSSAENQRFKSVLAASGGLEGGQRPASEGPSAKARACKGIPVFAAAKMPRIGIRG
jgi:hypothetical protein